MPTKNELMEGMENHRTGHYQVLKPKRPSSALQASGRGKMWAVDAVNEELSLSMKPRRCILPPPIRPGAAYPRNQH
jgi:hypothetical protein